MLKEVPSQLKLRSHSFHISRETIMQPSIYFQYNPKNQNKFQKFVTEVWLKKHGKGNFIDFDANQRATIRSFFRQLDRSGSGKIGVEELYEPLLSLGLVDEKKQLREMVKKVDSKKTGKIEFDDFLKMLKQKSETRNTLVSFFKNLSSDELSEDLKHLPFHLMFSNKRRELIIQGLIGKNTADKEKGFKVMTAFAESQNDFALLARLKQYKDSQTAKKRNTLGYVKQPIRGLRKTQTCSSLKLSKTRSMSFSSVSKG